MLGLIWTEDIRDYTQEVVYVMIFFTVYDCCMDQLLIPGRIKSN